METLIIMIIAACVGYELGYTYSDTVIASYTRFKATIRERYRVVLIQLRSLIIRAGWKE